MKRGDLFRVYRGTINDPKKYRVYLVVSRQEVIENSYSTVICAPIYTKYGNVPTQVEIGVDEGLKHDCIISCDDLLSIPKSKLTDYISSLPTTKMDEINTALRIALAVE